MHIQVYTECESYSYSIEFNNVEKNSILCIISLNTKMKVDTLTSNIINEFVHKAKYRMKKQKKNFYFL